MNFRHPAITALMGVMMLLATLTTADAKRGPAPPVNTVVIGSIAYSAPPIQAIWAM